MKLRFPTEYEIIALAVIGWLVLFIHTELPEVRVPADVVGAARGIGYPLALLLPIPWIGWKVARMRISGISKAFLFPTIWFVYSAVMIGLEGGFDLTLVLIENYRYTISFGMLAMLLGSMRKTCLRWPCFTLLVVLWAFALPKGTPLTWGPFDPAAFWGDFLRFLLPACVYLMLVGTKRSELQILDRLGRQAEPKLNPLRTRSLRLLHFGIYVGIFCSAMYLTLNQTALKLFGPSQYLLRSAELASPFGWTLMGLLSLTLLVVIPWAVVGGIRGVKSARG